jgi:hypothetical protein
MPEFGAATDMPLPPPLPPRSVPASETGDVEVDTSRGVAFPRASGPLMLVIGGGWTSHFRALGA